jgi:hypothetical protein
MIYDDPEEELLDQHLREAFSELELAPAHRIWEGIEGRMGALPGAARPGLPLALLLPAMALAGVAAGWLLPRPTATMPPAKPGVAQVALVPARRPALMPELPASELTAPAAAAPDGSLPAAAARPGRQFRAAPGRLTGRAAPVELLAFQPATLAAATEPNHAALPAPGAASTAHPSAVPRGSAPALAAAAGAAPAPEAAKAAGPQGFHAEYRQPTHRRAEKSMAFRQRLAAVGQWARRLVGPGRGKATGHPRS